MLPYKLGKIYNGDKEWFVSFRYWSLKEKKYKRDKVRLGAKGLSKEDRQELLEELKFELDAELKARNKRKIYHDENRKSRKKVQSAGTIREWITIAKHDAKIEKSWPVIFSQLDYNLKEFYKAHPAFDNLTPDDIDSPFLKAYRDFLVGKKMASKSINKHMWGIEALLEYANKIDPEVSVVPTKDFRVDQIQNETGKYPPLTHEEKELCFAYFKERNPGLYLFLLCQYYTCIRPAELHRLQIKFFDLSATGAKIHVPWYDAKNGNSNYVQILAPLVQALKDFNIKQYPPDYYLFGDCCIASAKPYSEDSKYESGVWWKHRERMGMPKEKQLYGLKHTFNVDYIENNKHQVDWEWLRRHNRHATVQQTQEYISGLTAYFLDETKSVILNYYK